MPPRMLAEIVWRPCAPRTCAELVAGGRWLLVPHETRPLPGHPTPLQKEKTKHTDTGLTRPAEAGAGGWPRRRYVGNPLLPVDREITRAYTCRRWGRRARAPLCPGGCTPATGRAPPPPPPPAARRLPTTGNASMCQAVPLLSKTGLLCPERRRINTFFFLFRSMLKRNYRCMNLHVNEDAVRHGTRKHAAVCRAPHVRRCNANRCPQNSNLLGSTQHPPFFPPSLTNLTRSRRQRIIIIA